ncbi:hypothetical protein GCM10007887_37640 [Methylobacterium haplocladii]|uniref:Uncharacterized protein n=1 Tax=Methylobacterium haplocladii TaxID=1176176 RepID=A0A512IVV1_9HYPH|nr:hypothetical protein MHA02_42350 [Methylobacterium haplocladii]GLS61070.1 hypothetical protein GCM10007887_37640 [Methylobacterium haplocladii]
MAMARQDHGVPNRTTEAALNTHRALYQCPKGPKGPIRPNPVCARAQRAQACASARGKHESNASFSDIRYLAVNKAP